MPETARLLDDAAMRHYLRQGYVTVNADLPDDYHTRICERLDTRLAQEGNWGNNLLPRLPELQAVFDHPAVHGALTSVLGPNYILHPHRYGHRNNPGTPAQSLHKDATHYSGDKDIRHHRSRWAMAFYYPQDVTPDMGPTSVLPGTQYYEHLSRDPDNAELPLCGPAGTVTIVNFDIWHRATANHSPHRRYMLKFIFARMEEPQAPSWNAQETRWSDGTEASGKHSVVWNRLWDWLRGTPDAGANGGAAGSLSVTEGVHGLRSPEATVRWQAADALGHLGPEAQAAIPALITAVQDESEAVRLNAAYALGAIGEAAIPPLLETLRAGEEENRRLAACALGVMGEPAIPALLLATRATDWPVRAYAVDALGDIARPAPGVLPALIRALSDEAEWVRRHAADALGTIGPAAGDAAPALADTLRDEKPYVRINAATALAKLGPAAEPAIPALSAALRYDPDRYTRGFAAIALRRIGTDAAKDALLDALMISRWCPITTVESPY